MRRPLPARPLTRAFPIRNAIRCRRLVVLADHAPRRDGRMITAAMGRSEDRRVKRDGKWLIQSRTLTVFDE